MEIKDLKINDEVSVKVSTHNLFLEQELGTQKTIFDY